MLMGRKANSPYHVKLGGVVGGKYFKPNPATVEKFGKDLEWLHNKHEWVTDGLTEIKAIDFGNIGEKFNEVLKYDVEQLLFTFQVPAVLMGVANVNEGIAKVQMDGFERRVKSFQSEIEKVIEEKIFRRILVSNGIDVHVEFHWGRPSNTERYERLMKIIPMMTSQTTSQSLSRMLEQEAVKLLELDEEEFVLLAEEEDKKKIEDEEREREEARATPIVPGQNANPPQRKQESLVKEKLEKGVTNVVDKHAHNFEIDSKGNGITFQTFPFKHPEHVHEIKNRIIKKMNNHKHNILSSGEECVCPHCLDIKEGDDKYNNIEEWLGFNYKDYLKNIEKFIDSDDFDLVKANTAVEAVAGRLSETQVVELKKVLKKGFKKGSSISDMTKEVNKKVGLKDLLKMENGEIVRKGGVPILVRRAENRGVAIVRSEVTRAANEGALSHFKEGGISKIRWVASFGTRTCPQCEGLNGIIFDIDSHPDMPLHTMCRCTFTPVTELA